MPFVPFEKGKSANPGGRPRKSLTWALVSAMDGKVAPGSQETIREWVGKALAQGALTGQITLEPPRDDLGEIVAEARTLKINNSEQWLALITFIYNRIEGTPKQTVDHQSMGKALAGMPIQDVVGMLRDGLDELERQERSKATIVDADSTAISQTEAI